ncbi:MAG: PorV/PorQ family protein [Saprospiraceae bacterium]
MHVATRLTLLSALILSASFATRLSAQKYSNEFLNIGVGARAQGMGNAVVAGQQDVYAAVWNPAGLAALPNEDGLQIGAMHAEWFGGVGNYDYLGFTLPLANKQHRIGLSVIRFGIDQIPNTLTLYESDGTINFDNISEFSAADYAFIGTYARQNNRPNGSALRWGGNVKVIHRTIGPFANSWGFGLDLGAQLQRNRWTFGLLARDITTTFNAWSFSFTDEERDVLQLTGNEVPINSVEITNPQVILGAAYDFPLNEAISIQPEFNLIATTDGKRNTIVSADPVSLDIAFGLEAAYKDFIFVRAGINQLQRVPDFDGQEVLSSRPSLGLGLKLGQLNVDYAYTDLGDDTGSFSHVISLKLGIKPKKER